MAARDEKNRKRNQSGSYYTYGNVAYELQPDYTPYRVREEEEERRREAARIAKEAERENKVSFAKMVGVAIMLFIGCIAFMGMHVMVDQAEVSLRREKSKLEDLLTGINPFNAKSRAEEICKILDTYIPSVEKMDTLLRKYGVAFTKTASENKKLKTKNAELEESLASAQKVSTLKQIEDLKLRRDYDSAVAILEQIPAEVLNIYAQSSHRGKERPIEQSL